MNRLFKRFYILHLADTCSTSAHFMLAVYPAKYIHVWKCNVSFLRDRKSHKVGYSPVSLASN